MNNDVAAPPLMHEAVWRDRRWTSSCADRFGSLATTAGEITCPVCLKIASTTRKEN